MLRVLGTRGLDKLPEILMTATLSILKTIDKGSSRDTTQVVVLYWRYYKMTTSTQQEVSDQEYLKGHQDFCKLLADPSWREANTRRVKPRVKRKVLIYDKSIVTHTHKDHGLVLIFDGGDYAPFVWGTETNDWRILGGLSGTQAMARNDFKPVKI